MIKREETQKGKIILPKEVILERTKTYLLTQMAMMDKSHQMAFAMGVNYQKVITEQKETETD